jgi:hypothetical protein
MRKGCAFIICMTILVIFLTQVSFAGYNYNPLIASAPSEVHPVGTDVTLNGTAIGGSGSYSCKWYKVNENGSETLVGTGASYHVGVINEEETDKYRFQVTDTVQNIHASDTALVVIFVKVRTLHFDGESEDAKDWGFGSAPSAYTSPCPGVTDGSLEIQGVNSYTYGYWESTKDINDKSIVGDEQPYILYMSRSLVKTDVWDSVRVPCTRLRMNRWIDPGANSGLNFGACLGGALMVLPSPNSSPDGYRPTVEGRYLDFFYAPSFREWDYEELYTPFSSSMDFVNFDTSDDAKGVISLEEYSLLATSVLGLPEFSPDTVDHTYSFETGQEGWQNGSAAPTFTAPDFFFESGHLAIQGVDYTTYGFWESPYRGYENGRLYRASFAIKTSTSNEPPSDYSKCPSLRLRVNSNNLGDDWAIVYVVDSDEQAILSPKNTVQTYDVYFLPPQRDSNRQYKLSFDYVNFNTKDNATDILYLEEVQILYISLSELFSTDDVLPANEVPIPYSPNNEQNVSTYPVLKARRRANYSLSCTPSSLEYEFYFKPPWGEAITRTISYSSYEEFPSVRISPDSPLPWGEGEEPYIYTWKVRVFDGSDADPPYSEESTFTVRKDKDGDGIIDDVDPDSQNADANNNGIPDGEDDDDNDGIPNAFEYENGMNTQDDDSDSDGLPDLTEISWGTNPLLSDSDGDLISDLEELRVDGEATFVYLTDPTCIDTDNDGISDYDEYLNSTSPASNDSDDDGISDLEEYNASSDYPNDSDTDNDGWSDGLEAGVSTLVPRGISPAGVLYTGTSFLVYNISPSFPDNFTPDPRQYNDVSWDFIKNGRLDAPEEQYLNHQQDPDVFPYWTGWSDCNNNWILEAFGSVFNIKLLGSRKGR